MVLGSINLMSKYAKQLIAKMHLTRSQKIKARAVMPKYWKQLMRISKVQHGW